MESIHQFINEQKGYFDKGQYPFLQKQLKRVAKNLPYKGLRILHNIPFTRETIVKLETLYVGGADLVVTSPSFMEVDRELVYQFVQAGGDWVPIEKIRHQSFDITMDCAAELLDKTSPSIGGVEITGTGTNKYKAAEIDYPVISVDQSKIKHLEGVLGTGEAFVRAFLELTQENIKGKKMMVFGYGKVGRGIAHHLKNYTQDITVVEQKQEHIAQAFHAGFKVLSADDQKNVEASASQMFAIVTATGIKNVISDRYNPKAFKAKYLANMGGEDEFGYGFEKKGVMCEKRPINFFVDQPTLMRYLDPVFYAHNLGVDLLRFARLDNGVHPFPSFLAEEIVAEWESIFNEKEYI